MLKASMAIMAMAGAAQIASANLALPIASPNYSSAGTPTGQSFSFTASTSEDIIAYFAGASAADTDTLGMSVNGVSTGSFGLNNQTSLIGDSFNLGHVNAGQLVVFELFNADLNTTFLSSENNRTYSTSFSASYGIPSGTFVAFEDLKFSNTDYDYNDLQFVFQEVPTTAVPEPSTVVAGALLLLPFGVSTLRILRKARKA